MAPQRKRENQFFDVGNEGRKTGVTVPVGARDENGLEDANIFSSPVKTPVQSPPKRSTRRQTGGTVTTSESMDIPDSSIPDVTETLQANNFLHGNRPNLPPPKGRSPMKTALGSSPRRQSSPRRSRYSTERPVPLARRLDFEYDESSLQETPALSGSGQRRGQPRESIYDIEPSPSRDINAVMDESFVQEEIMANEGDSNMMNGYQEETFVAGVGEDSVAGAGDVEEPEVEQPQKQPARRGRKRKSDALGAPVEAESTAAKSKKKGPASGSEATAKRSSTKPAQVASKPQSKLGRPKRVSEISPEESSSALDASMNNSEGTNDTPASSVPKRRGRPPLASKIEAQKTTTTNEATKEQPAFKKPRAKAAGTKRGTPSIQSSAEPATGKYVDVLGNPLPKDKVDQMSLTSNGSRYQRGRQLLSVYREIGPDEAARSKTGRHRLAPVDFWKSERIQYQKDGSLQAIVKNETEEPPPKKLKSRGRKRVLQTLKGEEDDELEDWEQDEGQIEGDYKVFDPDTEVTLDELEGSVLAWAPKGVQLDQVPDAQFTYKKLASTPGSFFNWGFLEIPAGGMKRTKNTRRMHMMFHVTSGAVEARVHENAFIIHKGGVWHVPRGNTYSIRNDGSIPARILFAQACEQLSSGN